MVHFSGQRLHYPALAVSPPQRVGRAAAAQDGPAPVLCRVALSGGWGQVLEAEDRPSWGPGHKGRTRALVKYLLTLPTAWLPGQTAGHTPAPAPGQGTLRLSLQAAQ